MLVDTHCHFADPAYEDAHAAVGRASEAGVWATIAVGVDPASNLETLALARSHSKCVWPAMGFHPERTALTDGDLEVVLAQLAEHHGRLVAVGEVGLPWYSLEGAPDAAELMVRGRARFARLAEAAARHDLPVIVHAPHGAARGAFETLRARGVERAVFHWHKAPPEVTRAIVDAGYFLSVTPEVVYRDRDRELVEAVPLEALVVESDGPWPYRGEFDGMPSGPWLAARAAEEVAKLKRMPVDETLDQLAANTCRLFDLCWT